MGRAIADPSEQLVEPDLLVEFAVPREDLRLVRNADGGGNALRGVVLLELRDGGALSMRGCHLSWGGGRALDSRFDEGTRIQGGSSCPRRFRACCASMRRTTWVRAASAATTWRRENSRWRARDYRRAIDAG